MPSWITKKTTMLVKRLRPELALFFTSCGGRRVIFGQTGARWLIQFCAVLLSGVFLLFGIVYLCLGHWTVTHHDFWRIYDVCLNHTWLQSALLKHNGHSLFFPSFLWLADLRFFHGNQQFIFFAAFALLLITASQLLILIWRDKAITPTAASVSTLVVIMGNFWMVRAPIIASGGFNWISSVLFGGVELAVFSLPLMRISTDRFRLAVAMAVFGGLIASFSFGAGLAIWPVLLLLAWCLRLPPRSFIILLLSTGASAAIFILLPSQSSAVLKIDATHGVAPAIGAGAVNLCRMLGAPVYYAASAWHANALTVRAAQAPPVFLCGGLSLLAALAAIVSATARRKLAKNDLEFVGLALVAFNLAAAILIVIGRSSHFRAMPFEVVAPRYLFFTTLFWTGLLLLAVKYVQSASYLCWLTYVGILALPVLIFPSHHKGGLQCRQATQLGQYSSMSLVNGVRDQERAKILFHNPQRVYRLAKQLRARRLDMFAAGLHDWIGVHEGVIFGGRHRRTKLQGRCLVNAILECDNGLPAARLVGRISKYHGSVPKAFVVLDPSGTICGVAGSSTLYSEIPLINSLFYWQRTKPVTTLFGYIQSYDPTAQYVVRSVDSAALSDEVIKVPVSGLR